MLEYYQTILEKVSFDTSLFERELAKALRSVTPEEALSLHGWCCINFTDPHLFSIQKIYNRFKR